MAPHSSTLAWKIPCTEEPGRLQFMGLLRVGHDRATSLSVFTFMHRRRKWQPTPVFLPGESHGRGSLVCCRLWGRTESDMTEATQHSNVIIEYNNCVCEFVLSPVRLFAALWTVFRQASLSMGFSSQEYWNGKPFPPPGDLPDPGIKPVIPTLQEQSLLLSHPGFMDPILQVGCSFKFFTCISSFSLIKIL